MSNSDWVLVGTTLFLGTVALFVPYLAEVLKRKFFAPKLIISYKHQPPFYKKTYFSVRGQDKKFPVYFFNFQVENIGQSQARYCEAIIEEFWIYDVSGKPQKYPNFSAPHLRYDEQGTRFLQINPTRRLNWNIGHIASREFQEKFDLHSDTSIPGQADDRNRFMLEQMEILNSQPNSFGAGKYAIKVGVYSENSPPVSSFFQIIWSGKWQDTEVEMFREIVISEIKSP